MGVPAHFDQLTGRSQGLLARLVSLLDAHEIASAELQPPEQPFECRIRVCVQGSPRQVRPRWRLNAGLDLAPRDGVLQVSQRLGHALALLAAGLAARRHQAARIIAAHEYIGRVVPG